MKRSLTHLALVALFVAGPLAYAQQNAQPNHDQHDNRPREGRGPDDYHIMPEGMPNLWWRIPGLAQKIGLSADQQKRMDDILSQNRNQLMQLSHELHQQRGQLEPMLNANPVESTKIGPQIERVAQSRAALEVAFAKMLLNIRAVLTPDQWNKLQAENRRWQAEHPHNDQDRHDRPSGMQPPPKSN